MSIKTKVMNHDYDHDYDFEKPLLTKSLFAGLFTGLLACLVNLVYNFIYRDVTGFELSVVVNVSTIIFFSVLIPVVAGLIFFFLVKYFKQGLGIFVVAMILLTALGIWGSLGIHRSPNQHISNQFEGLFLGVIAVIGLMEAFLIPYFFKHNKAFL